MNHDATTVSYASLRRVSAHQRWLHVYAVCLASATLLLIVAGGMVTSTNSGLAVPDWPTTYGQNMFTYPPEKWVGGILYEHGHRLIASTVGFMTIILVVWLYLKESRRWLRNLGGIALLAVICQGVLGGITVLLKLPPQVSVLHACLAQTFLCIVVSIAVFTSARWRDRASRQVVSASPLVRRLCILIFSIVYLQLILGAVMRHTDSGLAVPDFPLAYGLVMPSLSATAIDEYNTQRAYEYQLPAVEARQIAFHMAHRVGAAVVLLATIVTISVILRRHSTLSVLRSPALLLIFLVAGQLFLGAWTVWSGKAPWIATAHVAIGAATLSTTCVLMLRAFGYIRIAPVMEALPSAAGVSGVTA